MGIVNVTPDSFSDGGRHATLTQALRHAEQLLVDGADILDLGGESTRPGSLSVPLDEELARVLPLVKAAVHLGVPISVDTYKPEVMQAVLDAGADIINDVWALRQPGAREVVAAHPGCGICLMHMNGNPQTMQLDPQEGPLTDCVRDFLQEQTASLMRMGVSPERVAWDPGVGFGKTVAQNFEMLAAQAVWSQGFAGLVGWSRKSSLGAVTGLPVAERLVPSVVAAVLAADAGARVVRVHDVRETCAALKVWGALDQAREAVRLAGAS
jgi:dihydropteroate synthase